MSISVKCCICNDYRTKPSVLGEETGLSGVKTVPDAVREPFRDFILVASTIK